MPVRSRRLAAGTGTTTGTALTAFTCPAGRTAIVHHVGLQVVTSVSGTARIILRTGALDVDVVRDAFTGPQTLRYAGLEWVMQEGDQLRLQTTATGVELKWWISGSLLLGNPA